MASFLRDINYCAVINGRVAGVQKASLLSARQEAERHSNGLMSKHAARLVDELLLSLAINYSTQVFEL